MPTYAQISEEYAHKRNRLFVDVVDWLRKIGNSQHAHFERQQWPMAIQEGPSGLSPLRSDGSLDGKAGRQDHVRDGHKTLKPKLNLKRDYQARVHSGHMVLLAARQGG